MNVISRATLAVFVGVGIAIAGVSGCATAPAATAPAPPLKPVKHGATRPSTSGSGASFEAYIASESRWTDPETFLAADKSGREPNTWPDSDVFPPYAQTKEHDTMLLNTPDGPCEMYFFHTRWRRRADVRAFGNELRTYKACGTVFTRKIGFADQAAPAPAKP